MSLGGGTSIRRVDVLGVHISAIDPATALAEVTRWIDEREQHYVCVTGVHGVMESQRDPALRHIHNRSGLTTPDGMPMVWAARWVGFRHVQRVYGPDLMLAVCERAAARGWRVFFFGGGDGVAEILAQRLSDRYPGLTVAGTWTPPFGPVVEDEDALRAIDASGADVVFVGLSTPKQERWMSAAVGRVGAPALLGVGAAFDIHAGLLAQAPGLMQRAGLEWLFRLLTEPKRLWRRYLMGNPRFVLAVLRRRPVPVPAAQPDGGGGLP